ncbi:MAG: hypothetical protein WD059_04640 [Balneolaceae bacterium]
MSDINNLRIILNFGIGFQLHDIRDKQQIIIKGHIFIDQLLKKVSETDSFYKKTLFLQEYDAKKELIDLLIEFNRIRNHIAHEVKEIDDQVLIKWSNRVLKYFSSDYKIRKTKRTIIILAITAISNELFQTLYQ